MKELEELLVKNAPYEITTDNVDYFTRDLGLWLRDNPYSEEYDTIERVYDELTCTDYADAVRILGALVEGLEDG